MLHDFRLWIDLTVYFLASAGFSLLFGMLRKKKSSKPLIYLLLALLFSIGIGFSLKGSVHISDFFNPVMGIALLLGALSGLSLFFLPLLFLAPLLFSLAVHIPMKPLLFENEFHLGTMKFYPANEDSVSVDWIDRNNKEKMFYLEGKSAAVIIQKKTLPVWLFFLQNEITPVGLLSKPVTIGEIPTEDTLWYQSLPGGSSVQSPLYELSYPALKFHTPRFFNSVEISVSRGEIYQEQK